MTGDPNRRVLEGAGELGILAKRLPAAFTSRVAGAAAGGFDQRMYPEDGEVGAADEGAVSGLLTLTARALLTGVLTSGFSDAL